MPARKKKKHRRGGLYSADIAPFVTTWSGLLLQPAARKAVKPGDYVRVQLRNRQTGHSIGTRYLCVTRCNKNIVTGFVDDPYNGNINGGCDICMKWFEYDKDRPWYCTQDECWNYHECPRCHPVSQHPHKLEMKQQPFINGTIITCKRNAISEIPNWSKNTECINRMYQHPSGKGRLFTGCFDSFEIKISN